MRLGVLHTVTRDPDLVLGDDGLRILRAARFQAEMDLKPTEALVQSLARNAHLLGEIACERLRDELQKTLMADLRYPMLSRRFPASASGLLTIRNCGAWPYLFGKMGFDDEAVHALIRLHAALPVRMALLLHRADPDQAAQALKRMHFPAADVNQTRLYMAAIQRIGSAPKMELAKLGLDALETALAALQALGDESGAQTAQRVLDDLRPKPLSVRELAVTGSDLKPVFARQDRPLREMGDVLNALWNAVLEDEIPNEHSALMNHPILGGMKNQ